MRRLILFSAILAIIFVARPVWAQTAVPDPTPTPADMIPFTHTVQDGENLTIIATTYAITIEELLAANAQINPDLLAVGQVLTIPGRQGEAVSTTYVVEVGDTLAQVAALYNTTPQAVMAANGLLNPAYELTPGQTIAVQSRTGSVWPQTVTGTPHVVKHGESLAMIAAQYGLSAAQVAAANGLTFPAYLLPGQRLRIPSDAPYRHLLGEWVDVQIRPLPIQQGGTVSIYVQNLLDGTPSGQFGGQNLHFFPVEDGYAALVGIDAFTAPGSYELQLGGSGSQPWRPFQQALAIQSSNFGTQYIEVGEELNALLEPEIRANEDAFLSTLYTQISPQPLWTGAFQVPVTTTVVTAPYGDGRSYNGGPVEIYHTGVDFGGSVGTPILSPANGTVLWTGDLELRGGTVVIDHGVGVMSAYFHLSEIAVEAGDTVTAGQPIGAGGSTGLSTGPHLHWDLRVHDVPVNGMQWLETAFP